MKEPLSLQELAHTLDIQNCGSKLLLSQIPAAETVFDPCVGLVIWNSGSGEVRLLHFTVLEHLKQHGFSLITDSIALNIA